MLAPVGMAMALIVTAASIYSFSPRHMHPLEETRIPVDRMQLTSIERSKAGLVIAGELGTILVSADEGSSWKPAVVSHDRQALISEDLAFVRAAAAVAVVFLTFVRGASLLMPLRKCDVTVSLVGLEVSVWDEQNTKGSGMARQISIDISLCPLVGQVVLRFTHLQQAAWAGQSYLGFFQLPRGEPFPLAEGMLSHQCATQCVTTTGGPGRGLWLCLEGPLVPLWGG